MGTVLREISGVTIRTNDGEVISDCSIAIEDGRIRSLAGDGARSGAKAGTAHFDGLFALPGLIDMHTHFCLDPESPAHGTPTDADLLRTVSRNAVTAIRSGVTTARDLGGDCAALSALQESVTSDPGCGPDIYFAGPMLTVPRGHAAKKSLRIGRALSEQADVNRVVSELRAAGASWVKLVIGGAGPGPTLPMQLALDIVGAAKQLDLSVAVHANFGRHNMEQAVALGARSIEHGCELDASHLVGMLQMGTSLCPTLSIVERVADSPGHYNPESPLFESCSRIAGLNSRIVANAVEMGVPVVAGSDAGMPGQTFGSIIDEIELIRSATGSPTFALRSATQIAAGVLGDKEVGALEPGYLANILILGADPAVDLDVLRHPVAVVHRGVLAHES